MIQDFFEDIVLLNKIETQDETGITSFEFVEVNEFKGGWTNKSQATKEFGGKLSFTYSIELVCDKSIQIDFGAILKRKSTGELSKVLHGANYLQSPKKAGNTKGLAVYNCQRLEGYENG